ncbi:MAG: hypothetical protein SVP26_03710 [Chloroflexota bacterium]|nr:hypothetical protein [Chloroflexota bacterium]
MKEAQGITDEQLCGFLGKHNRKPLDMQLLAFWGRHPAGRFTRDVICYALDCSVRDADRALEGFVEAGLIDRQMDGRKVLYCLSGDEDTRRLVERTARIASD